MDKRITIQTTKEGKLIKIAAYKEEGKQKILTVWLIAWTLCGIAILSQLFLEDQKEMRPMLSVFGAFWLYFEYKVIKIYRWRKSGEEQILIGDENIHYGRTYNNRGFLKPYRKDVVNPIRKIEVKDNAFSKVMLDSYWVLGGETLAFSAAGKMIYCGLRLHPKEAAKIEKLFNQSLS